MGTNFKLLLQVTKQTVVDELQKNKITCFDT